jgi:exosome complex exonuclease DIS3/RRP44
MSSVSLWSPKSHYRQTRKGKILQSTSELYLRDDLGLGYTIPSLTSAKRNNVSVTITGSAKKIGNSEDLLTLLVPTYSGTMREERTRLVIVDTNVLLHNLDVLEHSSCAISNLVIPQTALLECRHRSFTAYNRVMDLLRSSTSKDDNESGSLNKRCAIFFPDCHHISTQLPESDEKISINEENDARIRQVASYYGDALSGSGVEVILLTDDKGCRELAIKEQKEAFEDDDEVGVDSESSFLYRPKSVREHIVNLESENADLSLSDLVAQFSTAPNQDRKRKHYYPAHLPQNELSIGVKSGKFFQGFIRAERGCNDKFYVTVRQGEDRVAVNIIGIKDINRAVDGDVVAIELHAVSKWLGDESEKKSLVTSNAAGIADETAEPSIRDENNVVDAVEVPGEDAKSDSISMRKPTGKVLGIIRRNFRTNYCGSIYAVDKLKKSAEERQDISEREGIASENEVEHPDGSTTCVFFAVDQRVPPVLVRTTQRERLLSKRILIAIDSWPADSPYPLGHYVKTMGDTGAKDVETEVLLHEHNIPCDPFPAKVSLVCKYWRCTN